MNEKLTDVAKPSYEELLRHTINLQDMLNELRADNDSLKYSLTMMYKEMINWKNATENWEEHYHKENERANKLYEEFEKGSELLEILKYRIHLKDSELQEEDVAFIEASGFVFKNSKDYNLLKEWLKNE